MAGDANRARDGARLVYLTETTTAGFAFVLGVERVWSESVYAAGSLSTVSGSGLRHLQSSPLDWWTPRLRPTPIPHVRPIRLIREGGIHRASASRRASVRTAIQTTARVRRGHGGNTAVASTQPIRCGLRPPRRAPRPTPATSGPWPGSEAASPKPPTVRQSRGCCRGRRA